MERLQGELGRDIVFTVLPTLYFQMEKVKDDEGFPFLMPKSYENVRVPRVFRNISTPCTVQVSVDIGSVSTDRSITFLSSL